MSSSCDERRRSRLFRGDAVSWSPATELVAEVPARMQPSEERERDAYAEGHAAGLAQGRAEAVAQRSDVEAELSAALAAVRSLAHELEAARQRLGPPVSEEICSVGLRIAEAVIGRELSIAVDPGADALARALRAAPGHSIAGRAHLHPDDLAQLDQSGLDDRLDLVADPTVPRGGCRLETDDTVVDATTDAALDRVRAVLTGEEPA